MVAWFFRCCCRPVGWPSRLAVAKRPQMSQSNSASGRRWVGGDEGNLFAFDSAPFGGLIEELAGCVSSPSAPLMLGDEEDKQAWKWLIGIRTRPVAAEPGRALFEELVARIGLNRLSLLIIPPRPPVAAPRWRPRSCLRKPIEPDGGWLDARCSMATLMPTPTMLMTINGTVC